tara:strand:+ start:1054 stop:1836 length:783 start_codon:yes stop_codon:yes gene_type:complete
MGNILPDNPGLDIQNVIYGYRIQKETGEWVTVYVQNELANGEGYVFRAQDDWKPGSLGGTRIQRAIPVGNLPRALWGNGSIQVDGNGSVDEASVVYTYKVTPCFDPQFDANCPNYKTPVPVIPDIDYEIYDAVETGDSSQSEWDPNDEYNEQDGLTDEELAELEAQEEEDRKYRLEKAMSIGDTAALFAENQTINRMNSTAQAAIMSNYFPVNIPGGEYNETVVMAGGDIPDGKSGLRNGLAQQLLHKQMVDMQYNLTTK